MTLAELDNWLAERNLSGFWNQSHSSGSMKPYLWKWADVHEGIQRAIEIVPMDKTGRRVVQPRNPSLRLGMSHTIHLSVQAVIPGEVAKAHRHVAAAIRYVIQGSPKCFTIVEGERFAMEEGDLITTPNWTWHDHFNAADEPVIWVDGLDARLITYLDANLFENFPADQQPVEKPDGYSLKALGHARPLELLRSSWILNGFLDDREVQAVIDERKEALKVKREVLPADVVDYRFLKEVQNELGLTK